jgi:hypothetical protein
MNNIALISATFGGVDKIKRLPRHPGITATLYTGTEEFESASSKALLSWDYVSAERREASGMMSAKYVKMHMLDMQPEYRYYVWADGSVAFDNMEFIEHICDGAEATFIRHPKRKTVWEEYNFCCNEMYNSNEYLSKRYSIRLMKMQMYHMMRYGKRYEGGDLMCGGLFAVKNTDNVRKAMATWWDCTTRFGAQDQLSLGFSFLQNCVSIRDMGIDITNNPFFHLESHLQ